MNLRIRSCYCLLLVLLTFPSLAQQNLYYVVIGGFSHEDNARSFMSHAHDLNLPAVYGVNAERNLYYVYVRTTASKGDAYATLRRMQEEGFNDAWVFKGTLPGAWGYATTEDKDDAPAEKFVSTPAEPIVVAESGPVHAPVNTPVQQPTNEPMLVLNTVAGEVVKKLRPEGSKAFVFKLVNSTTGKDVTGQVHLLETDKSNQYQGYNGNELVYVFPPKNRNGRWFVACKVIGFQPFGTYISYADAQKFMGTSIGNEDEVIIPLELTRVRKGEYIEMDQVKFIEPSDIFMPESKRELDELVAMMQENTDYRIRIHGHTNGDHEREMTTMAESQNFFAHDPLNKHVKGSARDLSTLRAEAVKKYLVGNGIEANRISVRGEGGKQPIFDPRGGSAASNARVEVEVTKH